MKLFTRSFRLLLPSLPLGALMLFGTVVCAQNVGVDVAAPLQKLDVAGGLRIGNTTNGLAGSVRWTGTQFEGHNGTLWLPFSMGGTNGFWSTTGNANTVPATNFLGTTDNVDLRIRTNNLERLTLAAGGNLGVGTNAPVEKLEVSGRVKATNPGTAPSGSDIILGSPANDVGITMNRGNGSGTSQQRWDLKITSDNALRLRSQNATDHFAFTNTGNLGISTVSPAQKLHISGGKIWLSEGTSNVFVGENTGAASVGSYLNTALGFDALSSITTSGDNTAIGYRNTRYLTTGGANSSIGSYALHELTTGSSNVSMGYGSLNTLIDGSNNVAIGRGAGSGNVNGSGNVFLGTNAGFGTTGSNTLYIDNSSTSSPLIFGDFTSNLVRINGTLNVNNAYSLPTVAGTNGFVLQTNGAGVTTWVNPTSLSVSYTETDPQVSSATTNIIPKWNGTTLVDGIVFDNGTNIGIGTTTPIAKLDIVGTLNGSGGATFGNNVVTTGDYYFANTNGTGTNNPQFRIDGFADKLYVIAESNGTGPATGTEIRLRTASTNASASDRVTINNNGNVGIGTSGPSEILHVLRNTSDAIIKVESPGSNYEARILFQKNGANTANVGFYPGTAELRLRTGQATGILFEPNGVERMRVHADGNVGIGTTTPGSRLHVVGNIRMVDGNQAAGRVLVSDANGTGSWTAATSLGITEDQTLTMTNHTLSISEGNSVTVVAKSLTDADNDTKIQVEESADEDIIRFDMAGTEHFTMSRGRLAVLNTGYSVFIGQNAGTNDDWSNNHNVGVGQNALEDNVIGGGNTAIGANTLANSNTSDNVAIGENTLTALTTGQGNTAVGKGGFQTNSTGSFNTSLGLYAGYNNQGSSNVFLGHRAGQNETGSDKLYIDNTNTASPLIYGDFGTNELTVNGELGIGTTSPAEELHVVGNIRMVDGNQAAGRVLVSDVNGTGTWTAATSLGIMEDQALTMTNHTLSISEGNSVTVVAKSLTDADNDTKIHVEESADEDIIRFDMAGTEHFTMTRGRLAVLNTGYSVFIGQNAGINDDWSNNHNVAVGQNALEDNVIGGGNTAIGANALANSNTSDNIAIGENTLTALTTGQGNTAVGKGGFQTNSTGSFNTSLGLYAGYFNQGSSNIFIGHRAGQDEAGSNKLYIDNTNTSNPLIYGDFSTDVLRVNGTLNVNNAYNMPTVAGTNGFVLQTDGAGVASWVNANTLSVTETDPQVSSATSNQVPKWNGTTLTDGIVTDNGTNVGIGTTSPVSRLHVAYTTGSGPAVTIESGNNGFPNALSILASTHATSRRASLRLDDWFVLQDITGTGTKDFSIYQNATGLNRLTINTSGNVGIGTNNASELLHLERSTGDAIVKIESPGSGFDARLVFQKNGANTAAVGFFPGTAELRLRTGQAAGVLFEPNGVERMRVNSDGTVGIGTSSPAYKLDVSGGSIGSGDNYYLANTSGTGTTPFRIDGFSDRLMIIAENGADGNAAGTEIRLRTAASNTGAADRLTIISNGNVGIATISPQEKLHVVGKIRMVDGNQAAGRVLVSDANGTGTWTAATSLTVTETDPQVSSTTTNHVPKWNGTTLVDGAIFDNGSVGIGTTTPASNLEIQGVSGGNAVITIDQHGADQYTGLNLQRDATEQWFVGMNNLSDDFIIRGDAATDYLTIKNADGNVGIGTTAPSYDLDIFKNEIFVNQRIYADNGLGIGQMLVGANGGGHINLIANSNATSYLGIPVGVCGVVTEHTDMVFSTGTGGTATEKARITTAGNVGIGSTAPGARLEVITNGTAGTGTLISQFGSTVQAGRVRFYDETATLGPIINFNASNVAQITGAGNIALSPAGNVGIGTTTPTQAKLVVNGSQNTTLSYGYLNSGGNTGTSTNQTVPFSIYASARIAATEFNAYSDQRIKSIKGITDGATDLNTLMGIEVTDYTFIDKVEKGNGAQKKVIAQQVEQVYPQAVSTITDVVPDIYKLAEITDGRIAIANTLKAGEKVRLVLADRTELVEVKAADANGFSVDLKDSGQVFVFGREVSDFRTVDYEALSMLNISATQELVKMINGLKSENEAMKANFTSLSSDVEMLKAMLNAGSTAGK